MAVGIAGCSPADPDPPDTIQVQTDSSAAQYCSRSTKIVPCYPDGSPFALYRVKLARVKDPDTVFPELSVNGKSGFTVNDFTGKPVNGGKAAIVVDGVYDIAMVDEETGNESRLRVDYRYGADDAPARIEVVR